MKTDLTYLKNLVLFTKVFFRNDILIIQIEVTISRYSKPTYIFSSDKRRDLLGLIEIVVEWCFIPQKWVDNG